ncbi:oxaloacetate decarboxylase subunit beta [Salmonella enterica subsp. enterica serovar Daytona]|uniref:Oxaloacetate decarboxylase subunit beta n=1 Tax=Salmonella enterica subsp. enterica serovar Daytona TaxID=1962639 RepID=A0A447JKV8_SALET|nr:oxaloacetate decarboxylase subunit beta [Salmonella enterica subsp. enterica serovar Daytona]
MDMGYTPGVLALFYKVAIGSGVAPAGHLYGRGRDDRLRPAAGQPAHLLLGAAAQFGISPPCWGR